MTDKKQDETELNQLRAQVLGLQESLLAFAAKQSVAETALQCLVRRLLLDVPADRREDTLKGYFAAIRSIVSAQFGGGMNSDPLLVAAVTQAIEEFESRTLEAPALQQNG